MLNKIRTRNIWAGTLALIACLGAGAARADTMSYFYVAGESNSSPPYSGAANSSVDVPLYLEEVNNNGNNNSLLVNDGGLLSAGFSVTTAMAGPASLSTFTTNPAFDFPSPVNYVSPSSASIVELAFMNPPVFPGTPQNGVSYLYLGTLSIQTGNTVGQTQFTIGPNGGVDVTATADYDLDSNQNPTLYSPATGTNFEVDTTASVPEPGSMALLGSIMGVGGLWYVRHKRRTAPPAKAAC